MFYCVFLVFFWFLNEYCALGLGVFFLQWCFRFVRECRWPSGGSKKLLFQGRGSNCEARTLEFVSISQHFRAETGKILGLILAVSGLGTFDTVEEVARAHHSVSHCQLQTLGTQHAMHSNPP
jgi:hypothetical protein